jgi:hypothetical protein
MRRRRGITTEQVVRLLASEVDDGFLPFTELLRLLPRGERRYRARAIRRAVKAGFLLERRGPDGRPHLTISSEGWSLLRRAA